MFYEEDSSKVVFFPIVRNGKVIELLGARLNPEDTYLTFVFHEEDDFRANALEEFASHKIDDPDTYGGIGHPIEGVVITVIKPLTNADFPKGLVDYTMPGSGNCAFYGDCGGGSGSVMPPLFNVQNPCIKTKALLAKTEVTDKIQDLKHHAANGTGEKGYKFMKDGSPPQNAPPGTDNHSIYIGDPSLLQGYHHTHPNLGMFSATDINNLINISRYITAGGSGLTINDAWVGMIGPGGIHYIMRFTGSFSALQNINYDELMVDSWDANMLSSSVNYSQNKPLYQESFGVLNSKGREVLFFKTLKEMGLENIVTLHEVDENGNVSKIQQDSSGETSSVPCQ